MPANPPSRSNGQRLAIAAALAAAIAAPMEGLKLTPYYDPPGILTVCRGHTGADVVKGKQYSLAECDQYMTDDMRQAVTAVERCHPGLPVNVLAAFADAVYNIGPSVACNSTASRHLTAGRLTDACNELLRWDKARVFGVLRPLPGLTKRRAMERALCLS